MGRARPKANHRDVLAELEKVRVGGKLTRREAAELRRLFGSRFTAALKLALQGRVKKYVFKPSGHIQWVVAGNKQDYIIYPHAPGGLCELEIKNGRVVAVKPFKRNNRRN